MKNAVLSPAKETERSRKKKEDNAEERLEADHVQQIDEAIEECRRLYRSPLISERTRHAYEDDWEKLRSEKKVDWMRSNVTYLIQALDDANSYKAQFEYALDDAVNNKWISNDSRKRWWDRFYDPNILEWNRKQWINEEFPTIQKGWKATAKEREDVVALAKEHSITTKDLPELSDLANIEAFLSFHYLTKVDKTATVKALILARIKNKEKFLGLIRKELEDWAKAGWLHKTKIGPWMKRVMESDDPEAFASKILYPFKNNWMETRQDFDRLNKALDDQGIPRGFRPVNADRFLLMDYKQRTSYCALAWIRLENAKEEDKELASLKLRIRHNLDTEDWDGAATDLRAAMKIRASDRELRSMQDYLRCHRMDKKEDSDEPKEQVEQEVSDPQKLVDELRGILQHIPGSLRWLYEHAAMDGVETLACLQQIVGNGPWAVEHGYTSEADKVRNMYDKHNREMTKKGEIDGVAHVIVEGETATEDVINDDCDSAQYLYMGKMGRDAVLQKVRKNANNQTFRYWSILASDDISYDKQSEIVRNWHYPMKSKLRALNSSGHRFTLSGSVTKA